MKKVTTTLLPPPLPWRCGRAGHGPGKKQLVIVVKGLDNPFFEAIHQGCEKWNGENARFRIHCFYTGPASTSDEAGEAQIVQDMLSRPDTAAIAISPSNAPLIAQTIRTADADHSGDDGRRRPGQGRCALCARPIWVPTTT